LELLMDARSPPKPSRDKVKKHRDALRKRGLRPIQLWVPDVRTRAFKAAAKRQCLAIARSPGEKADQDFIDAISAWGND
jgi:Protein  of unknown function (DUF3018)